MKYFQFLLFFLIDEISISKKICEIEGQIGRLKRVYIESWAY